MEDIVILGAGGFGREIQWLIERINQKDEKWNILGYIDDGVATGTVIDGYSVLGTTEWLIERLEKIAVAVAVGNSVIRKKIINKLLENNKLEFPNLIDPSVLMSSRIDLGKGNLICAGTILTVDIKIGDFNIVNLDCTIGHDVEFTSFVTVYPSVNVSGCVQVGELTELGTGTQIIQGKEISDHVIVGAGSVVVKDLKEAGTYVGIPAKKIK